MADYEQIAVGYATRRRADRRIAQQIHQALGNARTVVKVGAGAGSYEPRDRQVIAVEPADLMISQRSRDAAPVVRGVAEYLPFDDHAFDAALALLTIHHWHDFARGSDELERVAPHIERGSLPIRSAAY